MYKHVMFEIPLFSTKCSDWENKKNDLLLLSHKFDYNQEQYSDFYNQTENYNYNEKIDKLFSQEISYFKNIINIKSHKIVRSWFEKSLTNNFHSIHNHGPLGYSAVCYIKYNKEKHKPLIFTSPFFGFLDGFTLQYVPNFVEEGTIIFFPSSINHYVLPNSSDEERMVISFNLQLKREYIKP